MSNDPQPLRPFNKNEPYELTKKNILTPHKLNRVTTNEPKNISSIAPSSSAAPSSVTQRRRPRPRIAPLSPSNISTITGQINPVSISSTATAAAPRPRPRIARFVPVHNSNTYEYLQELNNGGVLEIEARHNGTIVSSRPYVSPPPTGGRKRHTRKHYKKSRRTHKRRN